MGMSKAHLVVWSIVCMALGGSVAATFARPAQAQTQNRGSFRECYLMKLWVANGGELADRLAPLPSGWTPVGGAGGPTNAGVVLCR